MSFALLVVDPMADPVFRRFYRPPITPWAPRPEGSRFHRCQPCDVTWHDSDPKCWSCGRPGDVADTLS